MWHSSVRLLRLLTPIALTALALGLLCREARGDAQGTWVRLRAPKNPPSFQSPAVAYDSLGDRLLVYQPGRLVDGSAVGAGDVWQFHTATPDSGWELLPAFGPAPIGRASASIACDPATDRLFFFGGFASYTGSSQTNDLYQLSLGGSAAWVVLPAVKDTLRARGGAFMCIDATHRRLVLFGGSADFGDHYGLVGDLWTCPIDGPAVWTSVPVAGASPSLRTSAQIAWDEPRQRIILHGGIDPSSNHALADTWALAVGDTARWVPLATTGRQVVRAYGGGWVDAANDRFVITPGAQSLSAVPSVPDDDVYQLPLAPGGEWSVAPAAHALEARTYVHLLAADTRRSRLLAVAGVYTQAFALADTSGWRMLWPSPLRRDPGVLTGHVLIQDPGRPFVYSVGGEDFAGSADLWRFSAVLDTPWTHFSLPTHLPVNSFGSAHAAAFDGDSLRILDVNGSNGEVAAIGVRDADAPTEVIATPRDTTPESRVDFAVAIDRFRRKLVLFGGQFFGPHFNGHSDDDLWEMPLDTLGAWVPLAPQGPRPSARGSHVLLYDGLQQRLILLGGWGQSGGPIRRYAHDAWALTFTPAPQWTKLDSSNWDPPLQGSLAFDPNHQRLFLYHAQNLAIPVDPPGPTRVFTRGLADSASWVELQTVGDAPLEDAPIVFDERTTQLVVATTNRDGPQDDEVWALHLDRSVAALASLEALDATPARISLAWRVSGTAATTFSLSRRNGDGPYDAARVVRPDGEGRIAFVDTDVAPDASYTYRLSEGARTLIETSVRVPARFSLAFAGARPSPAHGEITLAFSLPADSPVRVELFDLRGARVLARDLGMQTAGAHAWLWRETARLTPGVYLARISTRDGTREVKVVELP